MQIEAVIVCENYGDFLAETLPRNMPYLDHIVVVTSPHDKETQGVCSQYSVECVQTLCMHEHGAAFNKGRAINLGLGHLKGLGWILHLDADIILPHNFKDLLHRAQLVKENLYGADRINARGYNHFHNHKHKLTPHYSDGYFIEPPNEFPLGARIVHREHGYTPIGYFQLWNKCMGKRYPINQGTAEHTDVLFAAQWTRNQRVLLPEVIVTHLESEHCEMGKNWNGRKSKRWCCGGHKHPCHPYRPK